MDHGVQKVKMRNRVKFRGNQSKHYRDIAIFRFSRWQPSAVLVGGENVDAVFLWKCDSQEHLSSAMNTIILIMVALPNIGGALCSTPQSLADAHY